MDWQRGISAIEARVWPAVRSSICGALAGVVEIRTRLNDRLTPTAAIRFIEGLNGRAGRRTGISAIIADARLSSEGGPSHLFITGRLANSGPAASARLPRQNDGVMFYEGNSVQRAGGKPLTAPAVGRSPAITEMTDAAGSRGISGSRVLTRIGRVTLGGRGSKVSISAVSAISRRQPLPENRKEGGAAHLALVAFCPTSITFRSEIRLFLSEARASSCQAIRPDGVSLWYRETDLFP